LANTLKSEGAKGELFPMKADITKEEDIKRVVKWTKENLGGADVLINNAGVAPTCNLYSNLKILLEQNY
jgi:NAD(P)-dependent dehydrogenase (short-subunit alcohol dehydrogenase family)